MGGRSLAKKVSQITQITQRPYGACFYPDGLCVICVICETFFETSSREFVLYPRVGGCLGNRFRDKDGSVFDVRDYDTFVVNGDSMRYCGITDGSLIFVTKGVAVGDLETLPKPVVIEWDDHKAQEVGYKLRRAWATWIPAENPDDMLRAIFENPKFAQLRDASAFDGERAMVEDFKSVRLPRYLRLYGTADGGSLTDVALVSTTYHVDDDKIRFSIHPLSSLRGVVRASFNPHS